MCIKWTRECGMVHVEEGLYAFAMECMGAGHDEEGIGSKLNLTLECCHATVTATPAVQFAMHSILRMTLMCQAVALRFS